MKILEAPALDRILDPISRLLTPDVARRLADLRVDAQTQARIDRLARRSNNGTLTDAERAEYETYVTAIDFVAVLQAKARAALASA